MGIKYTFDSDSHKNTTHAYGAITKISTFRENTPLATPAQHDVTVKAPHRPTPPHTQRSTCHNRSHKQTRQLHQSRSHRAFWGHGKRAVDPTGWNGRQRFSQRTQSNNRTEQNRTSSACFKKAVLACVAPPLHHSCNQLSTPSLVIITSLK